MTTVIAFDLSLTATGYAYATPADTGPYTVGTMKEPRLRGPARLDALSVRVNRAVEMVNPVLVIIEDGVVRSSAAKALGELHGVVKTDLFRYGCPFTLVAPASVKKYATGKGNAGKPEMLSAAMKRLGYEGFDEDEVDALWMLAMGMDHLGHPLCHMPESHRVALEGVQWQAVAS